MKHIVLEELIEQLQKLQGEQETASIGKVILVVLKTVGHPQLTHEQKRSIMEVLMSLDGITPEEVRILHEWDEAEK